MLIIMMIIMILMMIMIDRTYVFDKVVLRQLALQRVHVLNERAQLCNVRGDDAGGWVVSKRWRRAKRRARRRRDTSVSGQWKGTRNRKRRKRKCLSSEDIG